VAAALSTVKYHEPSFHLHEVSGDVNLSGLVRREDVVAATEKVVNKFDSALTEKSSCNIL
jgi:predicted DNA-binding protein with PD1-like motif